MVSRHRLKKRQLTNKHLSSHLYRKREMKERVLEGFLMYYVTIMALGTRGNYAEEWGCRKALCSPLSYLDQTDLEKGIFG